MGRAARWFRKFLGLKNPSEPTTSSQPFKEKRRWSFVRSHPGPPLPHVDLVVAAAGRHEMYGEEESAAVLIQSAFRGYLARRALRALRGLVKLQALVRGYIVRKKRTAEWLCRMQALLRAQARARSDRALIIASSSKCSSLSQLPGPATPEKSERMMSRVKSDVRDRSPVLRKGGSSSRMGRNLSDRIVNGKLWDQRGHFTGVGCSGEGDRGDKFCGVSSGTMVRIPGHSHRTRPSSFTASKDSSYGESRSAYPVGFLMDDAEEEAEFCTTNNSPQLYSASSRNPNLRRSPFTPSKSEDTRSYYGGFSDYPNYMAFTESSRAKVRSASAPRQRLRFEKSGSMKRNSLHGFGETRSASHKSSSTVFTNFASRAYPGSGRLDRCGMPIRGD